MGQIDLSGVHLKLDWSRQHFNAVDDEIRTWLKDQPQSIFHDHNDDFTEHYARVRFAGGMPDFRRWSLMIGDCVTNLRDALDHLVFAIASDPAGPCRDKAHVAAFVIANRPEDFRDSKNRIASVPEIIKNAIADFQPYRRPHKKFPPLLSVLRELANGSKHHLLNVVFATTEQGKLGFQAVGGPVHLTAGEYALLEDNIENESIFLVFRPGGANRHIKLVAYDVKFGVAIKHTPKPGDTSFDAGSALYRPLLELLFEEVQSVIDTISKLV